MKSSRFKYAYRTSASKFHKKVGDCLRASSAFSGFTIYQEYPVNMIDPTFPSGREKFDWVIKDLKIVIECHGEQHYRPVQFGGITLEDAQQRLRNQVSRDNAKKGSALLAGYTYVAIPYFDEDKVSEEFILDLVEKNRNESAPRVPAQTSPKPDWAAQYAAKKARDKESGRAESQRARARELRREQYRRNKDWLKQRAAGGRDEGKRLEGQAEEAPDEETNSTSSE